MMFGMAGCGGGGGDTPPTTTTPDGINSAPVANAGASQSVVKGAVVTLDGSASSDANSDLLTYTWAFTSKPSGSSTTLSSATAAKPTFTADVAGAYVLNLVVNDGKVNSAAVTVTITASVANAAPVANAGVAQNVATGSLVTLDGSGSNDANGDQLSYSWSIASRPYGSTAVLANKATKFPTFIADQRGTYTLNLTVGDGTSNNTASTSVSSKPLIKTQVNGIISQNTTWDLLGSPYEVTDRVQIANGVTLTIAPGVRVFSGNNGSGHYYIEVFGSLSAVGSANNPIELNGLDILPGSTGSGELRIEHAKMQFTAAYVTILLDSVAAGTWVSPSRCTGGCRVERNVLIGGPIIANGSTTILNNVFYDYHVAFASSKFAIEATSSANIKNNSFMSTDREAVLIGSSNVDLTGNYWGTIDTAKIDEMIHDKNDNLNIQGIGNYTPFLLDPDTNTPDIAPYL